MFRLLCSTILVLALASSLLAVEPRGLEIYFVDTEGGAATLIVTPTGESVLIDSGNPGKRDAERIHKAATALAPLTAIGDHIITHWTIDHYDGTARLSQLLPSHKFYPHGIPGKLDEDPPNFPVLIKALKEAAKGNDQVLKPGDTLALKQAEGGPKLELLCL